MYVIRYYEPEQTPVTVSVLEQVVTGEVEQRATAFYRSYTTAEISAACLTRRCPEEAHHQVRLSVHATQLLFCDLGMRVF